MRKLTTEEKDAVEVVNQLISDYRTIIEGVTLVKEDIDCDPIMIEGETSAGYCCQMMVDPKDVAPILLEYNYPVYAVLEEEPPMAMWDALAAKFGLASVDSVDL